MNDQDFQKSVSVFVLAVLVAVGILVWPALQAVRLPIVAADMDVSALAPHRAVYEITLASRRGNTQIVGVGGELEFEWRSDCDAVLSHHAFTMRYDYADRAPVSSQSSFSSYEPLDSRTLQFTVRRAQDGHVIEDIRGQADRRTGQINYTKPEGKVEAMGRDVLFPTQHILALIEAAREGQSVLSVLMFDGSDLAGPVLVNAVMGAEATAYDGDLESDLFDSPARAISLGFFDADGETPAYEMRAILHDNGVIRDVHVDYGAFVLRQRLTALEPLDAGCAIGRE